MGINMSFKHGPQDHVQVLWGEPGVGAPVWKKP